jgi:predicted O-methyltransferase YrrM
MNRANGPRAFSTTPAFAQGPIDLPSFSMFDEFTWVWLSRVLENWANVGARLLQYRIGLPVQGYTSVESRYATGAIECHNREELLLVLASLRMSQVLGLEGAGQKMTVSMLEMARAINESLEQEYTAEERAVGATGGWPGVKEAILYHLIRRSKPNLVIETGVAQGVSSTFILKALADNDHGDLISVDLPNRNPAGYMVPGERGLVDRAYVKLGKEVGWIVPKSLRDRWKLILGPSESVLPKINDPIQLFFHDSAHSYHNMMTEYQWAWGRLDRGGLIVSDDIQLNSAFSDFRRLHPADARVLLMGSNHGVIQKLTKI